jgi:hypothetical protein
MPDGSRRLLVRFKPFAIQWLSRAGRPPSHAPYQSPPASQVIPWANPHSHQGIAAGGGTRSGASPAPMPAAVPWQAGWRTSANSFAARGLSNPGERRIRGGGRGLALRMTLSVRVRSPWIVNLNAILLPTQLPRNRASHLGNSIIAVPPHDEQQLLLAHHLTSGCIPSLRMKPLYRFFMPWHGGPIREILHNEDCGRMTWYP